MALPERFDRRQFLRGAGIGAAGLAGAALLGCESSNNPEELIQKLLTTPIKPADLPQGLVVRNVQAGELDATSRAMKAIGTVQINITESKNPLSSGGIGYTVFKDKKSVTKGIEVAKSQVPIPSWQKVEQDGIPSSSVMGKLDSFLGSINIVLAPVDNVLVLAAYNNSAMAIALEKSAIAHLKKVK